MKYRSLAFTVAAFSSLHVASADAQSVYVAPGGVYVGAGPVYVIPAATNGAAPCVAPTNGYECGPPVGVAPPPAVVAPTAVYSPNGAYYGEPNGAYYGEPNGAYYGEPDGAYYGAPNGAYYGAPNGAYYGAPNGAYYGAPNGAYYRAPNGAYYRAPNGAYYGAPNGAYYGASIRAHHGVPVVAYASERVPRPFVGVPYRRAVVAHRFTDPTADTGPSSLKRPAREVAFLRPRSRPPVHPVHNVSGRLAEAAQIVDGRRRPSGSR